MPQPKEAFSFDDLLQTVDGACVESLRVVQLHLKFCWG